MSTACCSSRCTGRIAPVYIHVQRMYFWILLLVKWAFIPVRLRIWAVVIERNILWCTDCFQAPSVFQGFRCNILFRSCGDFDLSSRVYCFLSVAHLQTVRVRLRSVRHLDPNTTSESRWCSRQLMSKMMYYSSYQIFIERADKFASVTIKVCLCDRWVKSDTTGLVLKWT